LNIKIIGTGSYIPEVIVPNSDFGEHHFLDETGTNLPYSNDEVIEKFKDITGIEERRYADSQLVNSDLAFFAAERAIKSSGIDPETLDYIIVAHNFGDVREGSFQSDMVPCLAARVKHKLQIVNNKCVAYDVLFGCPGWIEGVIHANAFIKAGMASRCLIIGAETLSRVVDKHDRDTMIYSDGAGAVVVEATDDEGGILAFASASFTHKEAFYLNYGYSFNPADDSMLRYLKMNGRKIYEFALSHVPAAMKECLENTGIDIAEVKKIIIHQANEKMDEAIVSRFYRFYKQSPPKGIMPMSIYKLGNSSVATIPTLLDLILSNKIEDQELKKGDVVIFASVGAGMNINAFVYRM
jgi:3-oxoacyl-[acyl-carrier-protein] synthase III